jgi:hypothetical protein
MLTNILEEHATLIFRLKEKAKNGRCRRIASA